MGDEDRELGKYKKTKVQNKRGVFSKETPLFII